MKNFLFLLFVMTFFATASAAESPLGRLIVVTTQGCPYCREFRETVGKFYHKTALGRQFPLTEIDQLDPPAEYADLAWEIHFIPTFVVYNRDGKEIARFRGYRGEESFWLDLEKAVHQEAKPGNP
ncbi:MAG: transcriptional regulator [Magnetococcales bacterium]|nr:transcriptional regulator [Magnetococcales bacterium]MBF0151005.1 transcriptional regulator [Magnetococcales bacterium]MBF0172703.1 transcriptional regulator [Magnetococcales bacterium]MBF0347884.1 transcriptional regulator [Magnetococcales bacterium]MBF0629417.1 transcriptional regulator [Magnetococcales bacterium]